MGPRDAGFGVNDIEDAFAASVRVFRGGRTARAPHGAAKLYIAWLRGEGTLPPAARVPSLEEIWPILAAYCGWMREQRGIAESTLALRQPILVDLLKTLGDDPAGYTAATVRAFVLKRAAPHSRGHAQTIAGATRSFLRYLIATSQCRPALDHAVPGFANWRLATTPRFLTSPDLARVLDACDGEERLRDRAIVLLLSRLGLRASEVAYLNFSQIDWNGATLTVSGKARREERLPLPQEVGDAILAYIGRARPRAMTTRVFLTDIAPVVPLSRIAVKCIVRRALDRAGVASPHRGAHVLRHSAATAMLRSGVSLAGVGTVCGIVLRRRPHTTPRSTWPPLRDRPALGWEAAMLSADVDRYIALRRALGWKLVKTERYLRSFARYLDVRGDTHIRSVAY